MVSYDLIQSRSHLRPDSSTSSRPPLAFARGRAYTLLIVSKGDKETGMSDINIKVNVNINIKRFPKSVADKLRYYV